MDGYRDDRGAALARLDQLEAEHHRRLLAAAPARRKLFEAERYELLHPRRSNLQFVGGLFRYAVLGVLLFAVKSDRALGFPAWLVLAGISSVVLGAWFALDVRETRRRRRRIAEVDAVLAALAAIHIRVAPAELEAIHVRIAELEREETNGDVELVSSASRTSR